MKIKKAGLGPAKNSYRQTIDYRAHLAMSSLHSRFFSPGARRTLNPSIRVCANGCSRPAIRSRPVYQQCHRQDMRAYYQAKKVEHAAWRERNLLLGTQDGRN